MAILTVRIGDKMLDRLRYLKRHYKQPYSQLVRFALAYLCEHHRRIRDAFPTIDMRDIGDGDKE